MSNKMKTQFNFLYFYKHLFVTSASLLQCMPILLSLGILGITILPQCSGHGRLMEPPNRSSIWRFPEFSSENPPKNFNDNELFCGGRQVQHEVNGGQCGECGDPWQNPKPRDNEGGGTYAKGIIVRKYKEAQVINVSVELTAAHLGFFEFRLCPQNNISVPEEQSCFDNFLMGLADGSGTKYPVSYTKGFYNTSIKLPFGVTCSQCVLQWHYKTGNSWGDCGNGTNELGCGPQETFRGCADIAIY